MKLSRRFRPLSPKEDKLLRDILKDESLAFSQETEWVVPPCRTTDSVHKFFFPKLDRPAQESAAASQFRGSF